MPWESKATLLAIIPFIISFIEGDRESMEAMVQCPIYDLSTGMGRGQGLMSPLR